jgi:hypothetical protein
MVIKNNKTYIYYLKTIVYRNQLIGQTYFLTLLWPLIFVGKSQAMVSLPGIKTHGQNWISNDSRKTHHVYSKCFLIYSAQSLVKLYDGYTIK